MSSRTEPGRRAWTIALGAIFAGAAALRLVGLQSSLWHDEIVTLVLSARLPVARIVTEFPDVNLHPLYSLFAHATMTLFGESASRAIVSVSPGTRDEVLRSASAAGVPARVIGRTGGDRLRIRIEGTAAIGMTVAEAEARWASALGERLDGRAA